MNTQTKEETFKQLQDYYEDIFIPYFILAIGEDREQFELEEYNLLQFKINDIYDNINDYKGLKIEVWLETKNDYDTITVIQEEEEEEE